MKIIVGNLVKKFKKTKVLNDVNCTIEPHIYGLLGPNGCGKTTFIRCLLHIIPYQKGIIQYVDDFDKEVKYTKINIGYLPQTFDVFKDLTVYEQLKYFLVLKQIDIDANQEITRVLDLVHLTHKAREKCGHLSGGMIRRVGIAQALLGTPDLLIFDEPTVGLDPNERLNFREIIKTLDLKIPIILSTHIIEDINSLCTHTLFMKEGKIAFVGPVEEAFKKVEGHVYICSEEKIGLIKERNISRYQDDKKVRIISFESLNYAFLKNVSANLDDVYQFINYEN